MSGIERLCTVDRCDSHAGAPFSTFLFEQPACHQVIRALDIASDSSVVGGRGVEERGLEIRQACFKAFCKGVPRTLCTTSAVYKLNGSFLVASPFFEDHLSHNFFQDLGAMHSGLMISLKMSLIISLVPSSSFSLS